MVSPTHIPAVAHTRVHDYDTRGSVLLRRARDLLATMSCDDRDDLSDLRALEYDIDVYLSDVARGRE